MNFNQAAFILQGTKRIGEVRSFYITGHYPEFCYFEFFTTYKFRYPECCPLSLYTLVTIDAIFYIKKFIYKQVYHDVRSWILPGWWSIPADKFPRHVLHVLRSCCRWVSWTNMCSPLSPSRFCHASVLSMLLMDCFQSAFAGLHGWKSLDRKSSIFCLREPPLGVLCSSNSLKLEIFRLPQIHFSTLLFECNVHV